MLVTILAELGIHVGVFAALCGVVAVGDAVSARMDKRRRRAAQSANLRRLAEEKERQRDYRCRMMLFATWDKIHDARRRRTNKCDVRGCMAAEIEDMTEGERAAVYSGRYAKLKRI